MIIENKILEQDNSLESKSSLALCSKVCFLILIVCLLVSIAYAEDLESIDPISFLETSTIKEPNLPDANISNATKQPKATLPIKKVSPQIEIISNTTAAPIDELNSKASHSLLAKIPSTDISKKLWQARIKTAKDKKISQDKNKLQQMIKQIGSVEFKAPPAPEPLIDIEKTVEAEPNTISSNSKSSSQKNRKPSDMDISDETLQTLRDLSQNPEKLNNPFELAEILFNSYYFKESAKCYQESLNRTTENKTDRAWILFQIGNCLQDIDPATSMKMYRQLIAEHPNSPWIDLAKAKTKLIDWYLKDKPDTLINANKS